MNDFAASIDWYSVETWAARIIAAIAILIVTHFLAKAVKWATARAVDRIPALQRHWQGSGDSVGGQFGSLAYWLVWLVGLLAALQPLGLSQVVDPVRSLTNNVFGYVPNIVGAAIIMFVGYVVATIVRKVVETGLQATGIDRWAARRVPEGAGPATAAAGQAVPSRVIALTVFVLILIPIATAALQALHISSLSGPLVAILDAVAEFLPRLILAAIIVAAAYVIARWTRNLVEQVLAATGLDGTLTQAGLVPASVSVTRVAGMITMIAIMLFAAIAAVNVLRVDALQFMLVQVTMLGGRVLFGAAIIVVGVFLARLLAGIVASASGDSGFAAAIVRYAIIALATAMGLRFMGLANDIVNLAFGLILGSAAVACALAFGLGGRATAHKLLDRWTGGSSNRPRDQ